MPYIFFWKKVFDFYLFFPSRKFIFPFILIFFFFFCPLISLFIKYSRKQGWGAGAGRSWVFWLLGAGAAWKKNQEPEPEPLKN